MTVAPARVDASVEAVDATALYERYRDRIFAFCLSRVGNRTDADDATQTTFVYAIRGLQRGVQPEFELTWLLKIAENVCHSLHRRAYRRYERDELPEELGRADADVAATADRVAALCAAVSELPESQRRAIILREWRGLSYDDIARELDVSHSAVETMLFRARKTLVARLRDVGAVWFHVPAVSRFVRWVSGLGGAKTAAAAVVIVGTAGTVSTDVVLPRQSDTPATRSAAPVALTHSARRQAAPAPTPSVRNPARAGATRGAAQSIRGVAPADALEHPEAKRTRDPETALPASAPAQSGETAPAAPPGGKPAPAVETATPVVQTVERVDDVVENVQTALPVATPPLPPVAPVLEEAIAPVAPVVEAATPVLESVPAPALPRLP